MFLTNLCFVKELHDTRQSFVWGLLPVPTLFQTPRQNPGSDTAILNTLTSSCISNEFCNLTEQANVVLSPIDERFLVRGVYRRPLYSSAVIRVCPMHGQGSRKQLGIRRILETYVGTPSSTHKSKPSRYMVIVRRGSLAKPGSITA